MQYKLGLDIGSISTDLVLLDSTNKIIESRYVRSYGRPLETTLEQLEAIYKEYGAPAKTAITGNGAQKASKVLDIPLINEIVAQTRAVAHLYPEARTLIEIGGEDSKLVRLEHEHGSKPKVVDFNTNSICAAGTGSFLDQQATRLKVDIEEFSQLALKSKNPPRVAGRCSVFAKTDMIHLQQQGTPDHDIIAGLCFAMARNFKSNLGKGKELDRPVAFQGGVAQNDGMIRAFTEVLDLDDEELLIPENPGCTGALGAILEATDQEAACPIEDLTTRRPYTKTRKGRCRTTHPAEGRWI